MSQSTAKILLFPVIKTNGRDIGIPLPVSICILSVVIGISFCIGLPNFVQIEQEGACLYRAMEAPQKINYS